MDVIAFVIMLGIGLVLTFFSISAKSHVFGMFGGIILILVGLAGIFGGLQMPMLSLTINETGNFTTETVHTDIVSGSDLLDSIYFNLPIIIIGMFVLASSIFSEKKKHTL